MCFLLNMLAAHNSQPLFKPSVIYLEDKPLEIVKTSGVKKKEASRTRTRNGVNSKETQPRCHAKRGKKSNVNKIVKQEEKLESTDANDPLFMPQVEVKLEIKLEETKIYEENYDLETEKMYTLKQQQEEQQQQHVENADDDELKSEKKIRGDSDGELSELEDMDEDDEPLMLLKEISRSKKQKKKLKTPTLRNCLDTCRFRCTMNFLNCQRMEIFRFYWQLSKQERLNFIRQHMRKPVLTRMRNKKRGTNSCYFLKHYKIGGTDLAKQPENETAAAADDGTSGNLIKVCRKFFEGTLGISYPEIREALKGYELQYEKIVRPLLAVKNEVEKNVSEKSPDKAAKPQQFLDPVTGNLTETKPKIKTKRRKPGEPAPEHFPQPINCAIRCSFKCHQNFSEKERKQICDMFWTLDFKRRKDFILARMEAKDVQTPTIAEFRKSNRVFRSYQSKFYLRSGLHDDNKRVCKHFIMKTLCINHNFIQNAVKNADKTTGNYTGVNGRGKHLVHKISPERKQAIFDHINSYPVWMPSKKSKLRCLHHSLTIKRMYNEYRARYLETEIKPVSAFYYCKVFHDEFRLRFLSNKESRKSRGFLDNNPNISHYTGDEPGGCWLDSKGNQLELSSFNPAESLKSLKRRQSKDSTPHLNQPLNFATAAAAHHLAYLVGASTDASTSALHARTEI